MERIAITIRLKKGAHKQAAELIASGPPFDPEESGFDRHAVYLSKNEVVFVFEGQDVESHVDDLMFDPLKWLVSAAISAWRPLVEGHPQVAREVFSWDRNGAAAAPASPA